MLTRLSRTELVLLAVVGVCLLAALIYSFAVANWEFVYYSLWMVVFAGGILWLHLRIRLPLLLLIGLVAWAAIHLAGGIVPIPERFLDPGVDHATLYNFRPLPWLPKYDQVTHAYGFFISTLCAWRAVRATHIIQPRVGFGLALAVGLIGMGLGAMNEVIEFGAVLLFPKTNVGGYLNTGWDLVSNLCGCAAAAALIWQRESVSSPSPAGEPRAEDRPPSAPRAPAP